MLIVLVGLAVLVVFAIAAGVVGREARRLDAVPPAAVYDLDEATEYVANHLPFAVSAVLSYDDVHRVLGWNLAYLDEKGVRVDPGLSLPDRLVVVRESEGTAFVVARAAEAGLDLTPTQVAAVLDTQLDYLAAIGAIGPRAEGPEL